VAVSKQFNALVLDLLGEVTAVSARRMFGGVGYYAAGLFFALADEDVLYLRVNDSNRGDFEREGMAAFSPLGPGSRSMSYFALPPRLYDEPEELAQWTRRAIAVARVAPPTRSRSASRVAPRRGR
jgi:DNA transformation protein and related proteins